MCVLFDHDSECLWTDEVAVHNGMAVFFIQCFVSRRCRNISSTQHIAEFLPGLTLALYSHSFTISSYLMMKIMV